MPCGGRGPGHPGPRETCGICRSLQGSKQQPLIHLLWQTVTSLGTLAPRSSTHLILLYSEFDCTGSTMLAVLAR